jgi:hypothetical protein
MLSLCSNSPHILAFPAVRHTSRPPPSAYHSIPCPLPPSPPTHSQTHSFTPTSPHPPTRPSGARACAAGSECGFKLPGPITHTRHAWCWWVQQQRPALPCRPGSLPAMASCMCPCSSCRWVPGVDGCRGRGVSNAATMVYCVGPDMLAMVCSLLLVVACCACCLF